MPPFQAENPDYVATVAASFARQGLHAPGVTSTSAMPSACIPQQQGLHGALIGAMLDSAGGYAGYSLMPPASEVLTAEYKINFIAAAAGERLIARGRVIRPGRTITVTTAEAFSVQDGVESACAIMLQSLIRVTAPG